MFAQRLSSDWLSSSRLDTDFYNPEAIRVIECICSRSHERFQNAGKVWGFGAYELCNNIEVTDNPNSPGFIKIGDLLSPFINVDGVLAVTKATHEMLHMAEVKPGDIVYSIAGTIGASAIIPRTSRLLTGNQALLKFRADFSKFDNYFISAYGLTKQFKLIVMKEAGGAIQKNLYLYNFLTIPIPKPDLQVQAYIGNKVRQAELLKEWANILDKKIKNYFDNLLNNIPTKKVSKKHATVSPDVLIPRINAEFYSEDYRQVEKALKENFDSLVTIEDIAPVNKNKNKPVSKCTYFEIGDVDCVTGKFENGTTYELGDAPNNAQRKANFGDILLSTRRPHRGAVAVVENEDKGNYYSVFLVRLVPKNLGLSYWLKEYLRHDVGKALMLMRCTWTTYPVISEDDISTIPVPKVEEDWSYVGDLASLKNKLHSLSNNLTKLSQLLVESLIDGEISELQLIEAQQALEDGDKSKDRSILSKITDQGYLADDGKPLFTDLDKLYELLDEAKVAVDANEESD
ncbi:restriction endonuclease subunit S [Pseudoalteromonas distincta]|uniref:restriction endonuclease subunit S n=1 Tax=Pseudoalteromonas distincta TaxID=77608 RepID=UPI0011F2B1D6|nr:restriction endonuclease subunit S [Pseudoalteromonas distincta]KAA1160025.1 restriction endonuclease subunit S [Pseudoalteromonas distincta]